MVYLDIGMNIATQFYSEYAVDERKIGKRRRELLRRIVLEREEAIRMEQELPQTREKRRLTIP